MSNGNENQAGNKKKTRFLSDVTWTALANVNNLYLSRLGNGLLNAESAAGYRNMCCNILAARRQNGIQNENPEPQGEAQAQAGPAMEL